jgi:signal transduction histidine kinase
MSPVVATTGREPRQAPFASPALIAHLASVVEADSSRQVGALVHDLVHELRQPLLGVSLICELLLQGPDVPLEAQAWIRRILDQGAAMSGLCREMVSTVEDAS